MTYDEPLDPEWRSLGTHLTPAGNLAGLPALSLPCGFSATHLPLGVQLLGRPFDEATLIDLGRAYQEITDWHKRRPPVPPTEAPA
jgi:aspartyl-tRNA(Asn)/glutamyl-tRNA(Gln) amidotransferase subunit A